MNDPINPVINTNLGNMWHQGKVRDTYEIDDTHLLMISSDRISAFDVVLNDPIPGKGIILTELSKFWFDKLSDIVNNHYERDPNQSDRENISTDEINRGIIVRKAERIDIECVVRGYLAGSGWKEYQNNQSVCGIKLEEGLIESSKLSEPIFTPSTKEDEGHDENISFEVMSDMVGKELSEKLKDISLNLYKTASEYALTKNIIIADTKFEFGIDSEDNLILIDEVFTPDCSRFWLYDIDKNHIDHNSFDKQFFRDYLLSINWDSQQIVLPANIKNEIMKRYKLAYKLITDNVDGV